MCCSIMEKKNVLTWPYPCFCSMMKVINWKDNKNKLKDPRQVIKLSSSSLIKEPKKSIYGTDGMEPWTPQDWLCGWVPIHLCLSRSTCDSVDLPLPPPYTTCQDSTALSQVSLLHNIFFLNDDLAALNLFFTSLKIFR